MTRRLNFREVEAFRAVMQAGTATEAARLLNTTQPSISRLLAQVSAATGLKLFDHARGRLRPTREALALFDEVQRQFMGLDRIEQRIALLRKTGTGVLRVGCTPALGLSILPLAVTQLRAAHPDLHVDLQTVGSIALREGLLRGAFDVVFSTAPMAHAEVSARALHRAPAVCVMPPRHALAGKASLHVRDLRHQPLLTLHADDAMQVEVERLLDAHGVETGARVESTYSFTLCRLAAEGAGIAIVNPYVARVFARDLHIARLLPRCVVEVVMALPQQVGPSRLTEACVARVREQLVAWEQQS